MGFWDARGSRRLAVGLVVAGWFATGGLASTPIPPLGTRAAAVGPLLVAAGLLAFARRIQETGDFFLSDRRGVMIRYHLGAHHLARALLLGAIGCVPIALALAVPALMLPCVLVAAPIFLAATAFVPFSFRRKGGGGAD